jgi:hypothetical protein
MPKRIWTVDEVRRLGLATDVETAASVLRLGRTTAYRLVKAGSFPVKVYGTRRPPSPRARGSGQ